MAAHRDNPKMEGIQVDDAGIRKEAAAVTTTIQAGDTSTGKEDVAIIRHPGRCSGRPTVGDTRITVHDIVSAACRYDWDLERLQAEELEQLSMAQIRAAVDYYREHAEEIDDILRRREEDYRTGIAAGDKQALP
jgi:uncharacterized protein (DUF433 family)